MNKHGTKMSKLDRFLISDGVLNFHPHLQVSVLDKIWSDHNLIFLHCCASDEDRQARVNKLLELEEIGKLESMDLMQKARLEWDIEGDENSKFVH
nr:RNA-directed DNA polymerase, eukaryota [Tanacetum cinerariifolium]